MDLCGHATLASAHVLWQQGQATGDEIRFSTRSGILKAVRHGDDIELDFPLKPEEAAEAPPGLLEALGISAKYVGKNQFDYLVEVESEAALRGIAPDFQASGDGAGAGASLSRADQPIRASISFPGSSPRRPAWMKTRWLARPIAAWATSGGSGCGKTEFVAFQASARGGVVKVRVTKDRAFLGGKAITVAKGELLVGEDEP